MELVQRIEQLSADKLELLIQLMKHGQPDRPVISPRRADEQSRDFPLSFGQHRIWFLEQLDPGSVTYNESVAVRLLGRLDVSALSWSLNQIIERHEILRTVFVNKRGEPLQRIQPPFELSMDIVDLSALEEQDREARIQSVAVADANRQFDLTTGPLLRATLLCLGSDDHALIVAMHHIISDNWSMKIVIRELSELYTARLEERQPQLPIVSIQYADYALWQRQALQGAVLQRHQRFWRQQLANAPLPLDLPSNRSRTASRRFQGARQPLHISSSLTRELGELAKAEDATLYMVVLAAFQTLLHRYTGQDDIVVGTTVADRDNQQTEQVVGFFVNTLALRTQLAGNPPFHLLLKQVRTTVLGAFEHRELPFEIIIENLSLPKERRLSPHPLFNVMFTLLDDPMELGLPLPGLTVRTIDLDLGLAKRELTLRLMHQPGLALVGAFEYDADSFSPETMHSMASHFETLLASIAAQPYGRIDTFDIRTDVERREQKLKDQGRDEANHKKMKRFLTSKPKATAISDELLVRSTPLLPNQRMPLLIEPAIDGIDLVQWAGQNHDVIENQMIEHGAILFRGFPIGSAEDFERFARAISPTLLDYEERSTPRSGVQGQVYTSTEYPPDQIIMQHNEMAYSNKWPEKLWFYCALPAQQGGETPIADGQLVYEMIDPTIRQRFIEKGAMYVRNYGSGLDLPWQEVFQTDDRTVVEQYCRANDISFEWRDRGYLRTRQVRQSVLTHPVTGATVWFNSVHMFHIAGLEPAVRESLLGLFKEEDLPRNAYYGDGSPIEPTIIEEIRDIYQQVSISFPWQVHDVMLVDNLAVSHGRQPFVGPRKVMVVMA